jgi:hypothetical protein
MPYRVQAFAVARTLRIRENFTGFSLDPSATAGIQRGDGIEQEYAAVTVGMRGHSTARTTLGGRRQELEVGYQARYDDADAGQRRLRFAGGAPYRVDFRNRVRISNVGVYGAATLVPLAWLSLRGGARLDTFAFAVKDKNRPTLDRGGVREATEAYEAFGFAVQPKGTAEVRFAPELRWSTSAGLGTRSSDAQALSQGEFAPFARVRAAETGVVALGGALPEVRAVAFYTRVDRDLVFDEASGRNTLAGASDRYGGMASLTAHLEPGFDASASVTYAEAYLVRPNAGGGGGDAGGGEGAESGIFGRGLRMPYIPRWVARVDVVDRREVRPFGVPVTVTCALGGSYVAPRPLPLEQFSSAFASVDVAARARVRFVEVGFEVTNLFDRRNELAVFNYPSNFRGPGAFPSELAAVHVAAGPPRAFFATVALFYEARADDVPVAASRAEEQNERRGP